jgi:hypothetical protein
MFELVYECRLDDYMLEDFNKIKIIFYEIIDS